MKKLTLFLLITAYQLSAATFNITNQAKFTRPISVTLYGLESAQESTIQAQRNKPAVMKKTPEHLLETFDLESGKSKTLSVTDYPAYKLVASINLQYSQASDSILVKNKTNKTFNITISMNRAALHRGVNPLVITSN